MISIALLLACHARTARSSEADRAGHRLDPGSEAQTMPGDREPRGAVVQAQEPVAKQGRRGAFAPARALRPAEGLAPALLETEGQVQMPSYKFANGFLEMNPEAYEEFENNQGRFSEAFKEAMQEQKYKEHRGWFQFSWIKGKGFEADLKKLIDPNGDYVQKSQATSARMSQERVGRENTRLVNGAYRTIRLSTTGPNGEVDYRHTGPHGVSHTWSSTASRDPLTSLYS